MLITHVHKHNVNLIINLKSCIICMLQQTLWTSESVSSQRTVYLREANLGVKCNFGRS